MKGRIFTLLSLLALTPTLVLAQKCPTPSIRPEQIGTFFTGNIDVLGTVDFGGVSRPTCQLVTLVSRPTDYSSNAATVRGSAAGAVPANGGDFTYTQGTPLPVGSYRLAIRLGSGATRSDDSQDFFVVVSNGCPTPTFTAPTGEQTSRNFPFIGTRELTNPYCEYLRYTIVSGPRAGETRDLYQYDQTNINEVVYPDWENGAYEVDVISFTYGDSPPSAPRRVSFTVNPDLCPVPVITDNLDGQTYNFPNSPPTVKGTYGPREDCNYITEEVNGDPYNGVTGSQGLFEIGIPVQPGTYEIALSAATPYNADGGAGSAFATYTIVGPACDVPIITAPDQSTYYSQNSRTPTITFSGTQTNPANCPEVRVQVYNFQTGQYDDTADASVAGGGSWTVTPSNQFDQGYSYSFRVVAVGTDDQPASDYAYGTFRYIPKCFSPSIYAPNYGETIQGTSFTVEGYADVNDPGCNTVFVYNKGTLIGQVGPDQASQWELIKNSQPAGEYEITAVYGAGDIASDPTGPIIFYLDDNVAPSTPPRRRRRAICGENETACPVQTRSGRLINECVKDLASNLELCGRCDGPDCTEIPNTSDVSCVKGRCVACVEGYQPRGDKCIPVLFASQSPLVIGSGISNNL